MFRFGFLGSAFVLTGSVALGACSSDEPAPSDGSGSGGAPGAGGTIGMDTGGSGANGNASGGSGANIGTGGDGGTGTGGTGTGGTGTGGATCGDSGTPVERHGQLRVQGTLIVDECDQTVQLKGTSSMWLNWDGANYATNKDGLQYMRDHWNMSVFRISMGIDPGPGQGGYLEEPEENKAKVHTIVQHAIELGVYVLIDWHDHAAENRQSQAEAFFADMAETYGNIPNVLYEVYNEPLQVSWSGVLKPYHQALVATIRQHDPNNIIILGTGSWSQDVDDAAADPLVGSNLMYTLHFYSGSHTDWLRDRGSAAIASGLPLFVTEWGAAEADGGTSGVLVQAHLDEAQLWHDWMNQHAISWAAWKYDGCGDTTCFFVDRNVSPAGNWTAQDLNGHAAFVIARMQE